MRTRIESANIPADLLPRVERLAELLDEKLAVFQSFEIDAVLSAGVLPELLTVFLRMGVRDNDGVMRWAANEHLHLEVFVGTDATMRGKVNSIVSHLIDHLLSISGENLRRMQERLRDRELVTTQG